MTLSEAIAAADELKPNAFSNERKTAWINEIEGTAQTEVFMFAPVEMIFYNYAKDAGKELLISPPHDKIYPEYLIARIDYANGEYDKYENTMQMFNAFWNEFAAWFANSFRPADTHGERYLDTEKVYD